jgi:hypothetical protein
MSWFRFLVAELDADVCAFSGSFNSLFVFVSCSEVSVSRKSSLRCIDDALPFDFCAKFYSVFEAQYVSFLPGTQRLPSISNWKHGKSHKTRDAHHSVR